MAEHECCPHCGAELPNKAKACPACGSDEQTGWSDAARTDGLDLPDEEFNYDEYVQREFSEHEHVPFGLHWFWWLIALGLLIGFVLFWMPWGRNGL